MSSIIVSLISGSRLESVFPDGCVPVFSDKTVLTPQGKCYVLDASTLSDHQVNGLALLLVERWGTESFSVEEAISYVNDEMPLELNNFFEYCGKSL
jgi:hypothetical protein